MIFNLLLVAVISALTSISSDANRTSSLVAVLAELIAAETVIVPTSSTSLFWVVT